jgi:hypothetical protein
MKKGFDTAAQHLDEHGFCVLRGVLDAGVAADARRMMDEHLGPPCKDIDMSAQRGEALVWGQKNVSWPADGAYAADGGAPVIHTGGYAHSLQHPLYDSRCAAVVPPMVEPVSQLLRTSASRAGGLKLIHQNFRRTDPSPPPYPVLQDGVQLGDAGKPAAGFHMDSAFLPEHYLATPRLNYYILITALSPVVSGGAAFMYAPGSLQAAQAAAAALPPDVTGRITAAGCRRDLPRLVGQGVSSSVVSQCRSTAQEVYMDIGDVLVLDPMLSHAGSCFREGTQAGVCASRYVLFSLVADQSAIGVTLTGLRNRNYTAPATKYTNEMKHALPRDLLHLLDWTLPDDSEKPGLLLCCGKAARL